MVSERMLGRAFTVSAAGQQAETRSFSKSRARPGVAGSWVPTSNAGYAVGAESRVPAAGAG